MDYVEADGSTIDEAIDRALEQLGIARDKAEIEILCNTTRGLFGIGARKARVRASRRREIDLREKEAAKCEPRLATPAEGTIAASPVARDSLPEALTMPQSLGFDKSPEKSRPEDRLDAMGDSDRAAEAAGGEELAADQEEIPQGLASGPLHATLERARTVLTEIIALMQVEAQVALADEGQLLITGDKRGMLIGRRGQTLDALEYLVNRIIGREELPGRVSIDAEDYRERRRGSLEGLAQRLAERVRHRGKAVSLNPMSPRDRRIIHLALQGDPSLVTRSTGEGYYRRLVIAPAGSRGGGRQQGRREGADGRRRGE
jgi:spoIIIJ-associated protein